MIKLEGDKVFVEKKRTGFCIKQADHAGLSINDVTSVRGADDTRSSLAFAYVLWFYFGLIGFHRFYTRHFKSGLAMLVGTTLSIASIVFIKTDEALSEQPHYTPLLIVAIIFLVTVGFTWVADACRLPGLVGYALLLRIPHLAGFTAADLTLFLHA
jgi:multisubunit Na+/H+ antiporter MnhG subunit